MESNEKKKTEVTEKKGLKSWFKRQYDRLKTWYMRDDNYLRRVRFPGTKLPLLDVLTEFIKLFTKGRTIDRAAGVAFNFFVALFPLLLFSVTLIPSIPIPELRRGLKFAAMDMIPKGTEEYVFTAIRTIMDQPHEGLLSISIMLCLVFGSSGIVAFFNGFRNVYANYVSDKGLTVKGWIIQRLFAIMMLIIIGFLVVISVILISAGGKTLHLLVTHDILAKGNFLYYLFGVMRWIVAIFAICLSISLLYYFGNVRFDEHYRKELKRPNRKGKKYREFVIFSPGTILATSLFVLGTIGFNAYIEHFSNHGALYGSIGTLIILLLWIWIVSILILTGNDLNSGIRRNADKLSASEDNTRKKQVVIDSLKKTIQSEEQTIGQRKQKIESLRKEIQERNLVINDLEEKIKDSGLIIKTYEEFLTQEMQKADEENLENDSLRSRITSE